MVAGARYRLTCDRCEWAAETVGPHDDGMGGLVARLYCPACGATRAIVARKSERRRGNTGLFGVPRGPRDSPAGRLAGALAWWLRGRAIATSESAALACPVCGERDLILTPAEGAVLLCPRCGVGRVQGHAASA